MVELKAGGVNFTSLATRNVPGDGHERQLEAGDSSWARSSDHEFVGF